MPKPFAVASAVAFACTLAALPAGAEAPSHTHPVSDFRAPYTTQRSAPALLLAIGSQVLYLTHDLPVDSVRELWVSDGTTAGTTMLRDLCGTSYCDLESWVSIGSFALIRMYEGTNRERLWRSDGTVAGTFPLTAAMPASDSYELVVAGPFAYFTTCVGGFCRFWSSDGTVAGTKPVDETGVSDGNLWFFDLPSLVAWHDDVYFFATTAYGDDFYGLWRASRRDGRTERVRELPSSDVIPTSLVPAGDRLFFVADDGGRELWTSDGTAAGTAPLTSFPKRNAISECASLTALGNRVWFVADDGAHSWELWVSDGTPSGTQRATDFTSRRPFGAVDGHGPSLPGRQLAWLGGRLVFASVATSGSPRLWTTDGDWRSTALLRGCPGGCPLVDESMPMVANGDRAAFFGWRGAHDPTLWVTDGTGPGTLELPIRVEPGSSSGTVELVAAGGRWFVGGESLWASDGTRAGTVRLVAAADAGWRGLAATLAAVPGSVFFRADNVNGLSGLWQTTGTGAREVFTPPSEPANYLGLLIGNAGDRVLLGGDGVCWGANAEGMAPLPAAATNSGNCTGDTEIVTSGPRAFVLESWESTFSGATNFWSTDGTPEGTTAIRLRDAAVWSNVVPWDDGERALYVSTGGLWTSDGTAAGTTLRVPMSPLPNFLVAGDGLAYFVLRDDATRSMRLWSTDATPAGTGPLAPSWAAIEGEPVLFDGRVHLLANDSADAPLALWTVDPADGQARSLSLSELGALQPVALTAAAGRLWFAARAPRDASRWWLWVSDGTRSGTKRLPASMTALTWDGYPAPIEPLPITALGSKVYFAQSDSERGRELWKSNGTVAGTSLVLDLAPGLADGAPTSNLVAWRGRLWFAADDGARGIELWSTDGTASGTRRELDVDPGPRSSRPNDLTVAGDHLFFLADDGTHGRQLWAVD